MPSPLLENYRVATLTYLFGYFLVLISISSLKKGKTYQEKGIKEKIKIWNMKTWQGFNEVKFK